MTKHRDLPSPRLDRPASESATRSSHSGAGSKTGPRHREPPPTPATAGARPWPSEVAHGPQGTTRRPDPHLCSAHQLRSSYGAIRTGQSGGLGAGVVTPRSEGSGVARLPDALEDKPKCSSESTEACGMTALSADRRRTKPGRLKTRTCQNVSKTGKGNTPRTIPRPMRLGLGLVSSAAGALPGCGDCRNTKPSRESQDQGPEMQHRRSGEHIIPPRAFIRGVTRLCLKWSYKWRGGETLLPKDDKGARVCKGSRNPPRAAASQVREASRPRSPTPDAYESQASDVRE